MMVLIYLARTKPWTRNWPRSHVSRSMAALLGTVMIGIFIGISHHGQLRVAFMEMRPYIYLGVAYLLAAVLVRTRSTLITVVWAFVISTGLKAFQGIYVFYHVRNWQPRPESVLGHEDAYTFGVFVLLVAALWLFDARGRLRKVATWLLPVVIAANLANNRRAAWLMLFGGLLTIAVIAYNCVPERRMKLRRAGIILLAFSAVYIPAYWNKTGGLAQPARAIHSAITPDVRDAASDKYRVQETDNLKLNIKEGGVLGKGFGVPIDYALPIVDISKLDPNIKYIPHNGVLYIPMRMGLLGAIAMWALLGTGIVAGCRIARSVDREIAVVGALVAGALVAYALEGATDQGFFFYRIAFITGTFLGLAEAARRINRMHPESPRSWLRSRVPMPLGAAASVAGPSPAGHRGSALELLPPVRDLRTRLIGLSPSPAPVLPARPATSRPVNGVLPVVSPVPRDVRAIVVASNLLSTGSGSEIERLAERLGPQRLTTLIVLGPRPCAGQPASDGRLMSTIPGARKALALTSPILLRRILQRDRPTLLHADGDRAAFVAVIASIRTGIPVIWRRHQPRRDGLIDKLIARRCCGVIDDSGCELTLAGYRPRIVLGASYGDQFDSDLAVILGALRAPSSAPDPSPPCDTGVTVEQPTPRCRMPVSHVRVMVSKIVASRTESKRYRSSPSGSADGAGPPSTGLDLVTYESAGLRKLHRTLDRGPDPQPVKVARYSTTGDAPAQSASNPPRVARNLGALAGGQLVTWTMTLMWTLIVPRALGPVGLGIVVSAQSVAGVLGIVLGLGTRQYLVRELVLQPDQGSKLIGTAVGLRLILAPLVGLGAVLWVHFAHYSHEATVVLYLITSMTLFTLLAEPMQAGFQALERMKYLAYADVINKSAQSVIGIALVIAGFRAIGIAAGMALIAGCVAVLNVIWMRPFLSINLRTSRRRLVSMTRESFTFWAFGLFGFVYFWIDTIMLSLMTPAHVVGWYGSTIQILQTLMFLPTLVATAWLPRLVSAVSSGHRHVVDVARTPVEFVLITGVPVAAGIALVAGPLIDAVFGPKFANAAPVMMILAVCIPPLYLNIMLAQVLLAEKRQVVWTVVMAGAAIINPLLNLVLIPATQDRFHNGAIGAAICLVLTEVLMDGVGCMLVGRHLFTRGSLRRWALALVASAGMWAAAYAARPLGTPVSLLAGILMLVFLVVALRIPSAEEVALVRAGFARLRKRRAQIQPIPR